MNMNDFRFELFTGRNGKYNVTVSLSKPGVLSFSTAMAHNFNLTKYSKAQLYYDKNKEVIAIKLSNEEDKLSAFNLKHRDENKGSYIACKSFMSAHHLEGYFGKRYTPTEFQHENLGRLILVNLTEATN